MAMGVDITHVPYRGAGPVMQDLIGGRIDYMCDTIQTGAAQAKSGTVKGIAVMAPKRVPIIPDLPTTGEQGLPGVEATVWNAFFLPKGTPEPIVRKLNQAMRDTLDDPMIRKRLEDFGLEIVPPEQRTPEYLAKFVPEEIARWGKVIKAAGISAGLRCECREAGVLLALARRCACRRAPRSGRPGPSPWWSRSRRAGRPTCSAA